MLGAIDDGVQHLTFRRKFGGHTPRGGRRVLLKTRLLLVWPETTASGKTAGEGIVVNPTLRKMREGWGTCSVVLGKES